jgi:hypothetical protein
LFLDSIPRLHWGLADPSTQEGDVEEVALAFRGAISVVQARIKTLLALPLDNLSVQQLAGALRA